MISTRLQALVDAVKILDKAQRALCTEPTPIFAVVSHAYTYISKQLTAELRGE